MRSSHHEEDIFTSVGGIDMAGVELGDGSEASSSGGFEAQAEPSRVLFVRHISPGASDEDLATFFKVTSAC